MGFHSLPKSQQVMPHHQALTGVGMKAGALLQRKGVGWQHNTTQRPMDRRNTEEAQGRKDIKVLKKYIYKKQFFFCHHHLSHSDLEESHFCPQHPTQVDPTKVNVVASA